MLNVPKSEAVNAQVTAKADTGPVTTPGDGVAARRGDDRELVRRAQQGDAQAFEALVLKHQGRVFAVAGGILRNREDVEDISQQVFVKAYFSLKKFDQRSAFSTWLYKITVNECWDLLRKKKVRPLVYESELTEEQATTFLATQETADPSPNVVDHLAARQQVDQWLACLEERDRAMLTLKEVQGFTVEEIAEIVGINGNTVKVRLFRARQRIAEVMRRKKRAAGV
jgi:RNA polymerase sigma-70 factor (ECF subfamily)